MAFRTINYLVTGPLNPVAPEAIQEYRISTNNYSAEYGRTAGFMANAVTRAGNNDYHLNAYWYLKNAVLNAADFADNLNGIGRLRDKENRFGYQGGGRIRRNRRVLFELARTVHQPQHAGAANLLSADDELHSGIGIPPTRLAYKLLNAFSCPVIQSQALTAPLTTSPPVVVDRLLALERGDYTSKSGKDRLMARLVIDRLKEPDFSWSPYPDFITPLYQNTTGIAGNWTRSLTPRLTSELKLNFSNDDLWWNRAHPEIPTLVSGDGTITAGQSAVLFVQESEQVIRSDLQRGLDAPQARHLRRARACCCAITAVISRRVQTANICSTGIFDFAFDQPSTLYVGADQFAGRAAELRTQPTGTGKAIFLCRIVTGSRSDSR